MARTFRQLKLELSERALGELAIEIADAYVNDFNSKAEVAKEFEINQKAVTDLMDYAIIHYLVSDDMVDRMERKSIQNQSRYSPDGSADGTIAHYKMLRAKRVELAIFDLSDEKIKEISERFATETDKTKGDIALLYGLSKRIIDIVLKKAITEGICDDETFKKIKARSLENCKQEDYSKTLSFFDNLQERRKKKKKGKGNFFA